MHAAKATVRQAIYVPVIALKAALCEQARAAITGVKAAQTILRQQFARDPSWQCLGRNALRPDLIAVVVLAAAVCMGVRL